MQNLFNALVNELSPEFTETAHEFACRNKQGYINKISPVKTLSLSLTGSKCELMCSHCEGHYLKGMKDIRNINSSVFYENLIKYKSVLISGGSDKSGKVPIEEYKNFILKLPKELFLNFHIGFQSANCLSSFEKRKLVVSFDLPLSEKVINNVFGLPYTVEDYRQLYLQYTEKYKVIPHITLGLTENEQKDAENIIDFLRKYNKNIESVVFIIFRPTAKTRMSNYALPNIGKIVSILHYAVQNLKCNVKLGCMRPAGIYRKNLDILAWLVGINDMVMPHHKLIKILQDHSVKINNFFECCSLM